MEIKPSKPLMVKCQDCKFFFDRTICPENEEYLINISIACDKFEQQSLKDKIVYPDSTQGDIYTLLKNL